MCHASILSIVIMCGTVLVVSGQRDWTNRYALLIGVSEYPHLDPKFRLEGPTNDVALMRRVLEGEPFKFAPASIVTLTNVASNPIVRPTRANIERAFQHLAALTQAGDQVFVLMAGHGSQQPADDDPGDVEPDGVDEIFLPEDAAGWNGKLGRVENAIIDDDIRRWVTDIRNTGAFVWLMFDSCQSGTMVRGAPRSIERERQIPMEALVPSDALERARERVGARSSLARETALLGLADAPGKIAALYASQMHETTSEKRLPDAKGQVHGLFTYTVAGLLAQSATPMTYRELAERVLLRYRSMGRPVPTPTFEGGGLDREVLGQRSYPARPRLLLGGRVDSGWELRAGTIHGLTSNSILEVFPPAGDPMADRSIGHVKVVSAGPVTSVVEPVVYAETPPPSHAQLVDGARARIVFYDHGDHRLRVALQSDSSSTGDADVEEIRKNGEGPASLEEALSRLPEQSLSLALRTESAADADWFVRLVGDRVTLVPASGWRRALSSDNVVPPQFRIGRRDDPTLGVRIGEMVRKIARARNLMRLGQAVGEAGDLNVRLVRYASVTSQAHDLVYEAAGPTLKVGEWIAFNITNSGAAPLDVTLLFIDSAYGIEALYPRIDQEIDNRLQPGTTATTDRFQVVNRTLGVEHVVTIAIPARQRPRTSFAMLEQSSLDVLQARGAPRSEFEFLVDQLMYGRVVRGERNLNARPNERPLIRIISWETIER